MVAAAVTLWLMFALWVAAPSIGVAPGVVRTAAGLLVAELVALLGYSYGCEDVCTPVGEAAGMVARTDVPLLAAVLVAALLAARLRSALS